MLIYLFILRNYWKVYKRKNGMWIVNISYLHTLWHLFNSMLMFSIARMWRGLINDAAPKNGIVFITFGCGSGLLLKILNQLEMGYIFRKRINLGKGFGLNLSKSGISSSQRTRFGSFGSEVYSIRTGIPGVYYRSTFKKGSGCMLLFLPFFLSVIVLVWVLA